MISVILAAKTIVNGIPLDHLAVGISLMTFLFVMPALFEPKGFRRAFEAFVDEGDSALRLMAVANLLIAFLILNSYWKLNFNSPRTFMSVLGYLVLLRSIVWLWFPSFVREKMKRVMKKEWGVYIVSFIGLVVGLLYGYLGLWVY